VPTPRYFFIESGPTLPGGASSDRELIAVCHLVFLLISLFFVRCQEQGARTGPAIPENLISESLVRAFASPFHQSSSQCFFRHFIKRALKFPQPQNPRQ